MSFSNDPQIVTCDGAGCCSKARLPVALRRLLAGPEEGPQHAAPITGWLFVTAQGRVPRHYCPLCTPLYLRGILPDALGERPDTAQPERKDSHGH